MSLFSLAWAGQGDAAGTGADSSGLLFHLSADKSLIADFARGDGVPNFADKVAIVPNGISGGALQTNDDNVLSWKAPGNIYAQRGTASFFWRSRTPVGRGPFVIYRVGYADHTSWDMVWLRIDWNGHGYDAFVTDNNLARIRVSFKLDQLPAPDAWTHLAFTWDENTGVKLYVNGNAVAAKSQVAVLDSGLDQFGMAARAVSPHQVMSRYNFMRGSDYDELRIYDHGLDDQQIATLARNQAPDVPAQPAASLSDAATRAEWNLRYGWNRPGDTPVALSAPVTSIRKVEFADTKDIKAFMYKATDGISETTWPGVYNRSRLPGRNDYFPLPDWNTYVDGGKTLTLTLPKEPWNHLEIQGAAYGSLTYAADAEGRPRQIATRAKDQERTFNQFAEPMTGGVLRFTNIAQETPIQEIAAYNITPGAVPKGTVTQTYTVRSNALPDSPNLTELNTFIAGRYTPDARTTVVALPDAAPSRPAPAADGRRLPLVHVLIPYEYGASPANLMLYRSWGYGWENMHDGLDGIAIDLPALNVKPGPDGLYPLNIQVKDPIWPERNMLDITVSVKPNEARTLWFDLRDRILPNKSLYLTFAGFDQDFDAAALNGTKIRLVFKDRKAALTEHIADRFNQVKDNWGFLVEEHTASKRERLYERVVADATDLLRVDPDNLLAREYWADITFGSQGVLPFTQPTPPAGVPLWAFRQLEDLKGVRQFVNWWIDNRQSDFGDFGGGLSDDSDLVGQWPGLALMGVDSEKIRVSQMRVADAIYRNGMMTNGLSTIMTDELHVYEEGINTNSGAMYLNYGNPKVVERLMTTVAAYDRIISVNSAGHRHFNTNWYSGTDSYREGPWEWGKYYSYLVLHPGILMGEFNGDPTSKTVVTGLADGILAHGKPDAKGIMTFPDEINWRTDATRGDLPAGSAPMQIFWTAYRWTGDKAYLAPIFSSVEKANKSDSFTVGGARIVAEADNIRPIASLNEDLVNVLHMQDSWGAAAVRKAKAGGGNLEKFVAWEMTGDKTYLEDLYAAELKKQGTTLYTQTEGHWWTDRVEADSQYLQRSRLGGVATVRGNIYPGNTVSWAFAEPEDAVKVAILMPNAARDQFKVIAYNTSDRPVRATLTGWNVTAGQWQVTSGSGDANDNLTGVTDTATIAFEKTVGVDVSFRPGQTTVYEFKLMTPTDAVEGRPDLGIGVDDVDVKRGRISVTVHSLGIQAAPAGWVEVIDAGGRVLAQAKTPPLPGCADLKPHTARVELKLANRTTVAGLSVRVRLADGKEITQLNNVVTLH
ncbi:LamG-like jellyroll fold domain-containing protein [Asticcacaulis sp. 201]|uniref:LamG-like jellyroll fold domain-containing protein n=1 Tax=Asticcacaulis sp. 201 TaxID=3028787 RepID=UPI0029164582|nr:LamG-like jellyroll fold domain-containing protein [Asticcacaulis sp. 201]MDV6330671.1 LamG-like jellyroll fold domain-containing protein [Asticcacaulis sp. 201]